MDLPKKNGKDRAKGCSQYLEEAVDFARQLLCGQDSISDPERIHAVKSSLDAAIERASAETEKLITAQELLRELLLLVALQADPVRRERQEALDILEKLMQAEIPNLKSQI